MYARIVLALPDGQCRSLDARPAGKRRWCTAPSLPAAASRLPAPHTGLPAGWLADRAVLPAAPPPPLQTAWRWRCRPTRPCTSAAAWRRPCSRMRLSWSWTGRSLCRPRPAARCAGCLPRGGPQLPPAAGGMRPALRPCASLRCAPAACPCLMHGAPHAAGCAAEPGAGQLCTHAAGVSSQRAGPACGVVLPCTLAASAPVPFQAHCCRAIPPPLIDPSLLYPLVPQAPQSKPAVPCPAVPVASCAASLGSVAFASSAAPH